MKHPDWKRLVRRRLGHLSCSPEHEAELVEEIAHLLEDASRDEEFGSQAEVDAWLEREIPDLAELAESLSATKEPTRPLRPQLRGSTHDQRGGSMKMTGLWNDVRFALRGLFRAPGFTMITIATLALGIGATTAIFSVVNGVLLKPLPFEDQDELVAVWNTVPSTDFVLSSTQYFVYRDENRVFEDIGSFFSLQASVTGVAEPEEVNATWVTAGHRLNTKERKEA